MTTMRAGTCGIALVTAATLLAPAAAAQSIVVGEDGKPREPQTINLPYGFANDGFGVAAGWVYGASGWPQPQSSLLGTAIAGTAPTGAAMLFGKDLRLPGSERLFVDPFVSLGYYGRSDVYADGNPKYVGERAGSHDSHANDFLESSGVDDLVRVRFKYVLPVGRAASDPIDVLRLDRGLPVAGSRRAPTLDPFENGKCYVEVAPFYRRLEVSADDVDDFVLATNGAEGSLFLDNRDWNVDPSCGQSFRAKWIEDFGLGDSSESWTAAQFELDQYFSLGSSDLFRRQVLALDAWTSVSPSWDEQPDGSIDHRPPPFYGSSLGGYWRMRAYAPQRFSDRAAVAYSAELRLTPEWNPFTSFPGLQERVGVQWIQLAPFVEVGRVAEEWNARELHHDMKWDAGLGLRAFARGLLIRIDAAVSDEGLGVRMMVGQSFQF